MMVKSQEGSWLGQLLRFFMKLFGRIRQELCQEPGGSASSEATSRELPPNVVEFEEKTTRTVKWKTHEQEPDNE